MSKKKRLIQQQAVTIAWQQQAMEAQQITLAKVQAVIECYDKAIWAAGEDAQRQIASIVAPHLMAAQIAAGHQANVCKQAQAAIAAAGA